MAELVVVCYRGKLAEVGGEVGGLPEFVVAGMLQAGGCGARD